MAVADVTKSKSTAPGQYLGYGLQPVRMCLHLFTAPANYMVSLEHLDDVAIHAPNGNVVLEQTKSALSSNPAADRSVELWKTLANWADICVAATVDPESTIFRYYITPVKHGQLVSKISAATNVNEANALLSQFKSQAFKGKPGVGIEPHLMRFLAAGDEICRQIICNFVLVSEADPLQPIKAILQATLPQEAIDQFCAAAIGQAKDDAEALIRSRQFPLVPTGPFRKKFQEFARKYNFANLLQPTRHEPNINEIVGVRGTLPIFVQQLEAIAASEDLITAAVSDFLRTTSDKINWAAEGNIVEGSLDDLDSSLQRHHLLSRDEIEDIYAGLEVTARGRHLYRKCTNLQMPLDGRTLPLYFVSGEYNCLADDRRLGWHLDYKTLFSGE